jgi:hypothetical protein
MKFSLLRAILFLISTAICLGFDKDDLNFVPDHPGKASIIVETSSTPRFGLKPAEATAFHTSLKRFSDLMLTQPVFTPVIGVDLEGNVRAADGGTVIKTEPIRGHGRLIYYPHLLNPTTGKVHKIIASNWVAQVFFNDPTRAFVPSGKYFSQPKPAGQFDGFPVYRDDSSNEFIILSNTGKPMWLPLSREEYLQICIKGIEKELADEKAELAKSRSDITPEQLALLSPKDRAEIEKLLSGDTALNILEQRLKLHREALARMAPEERAAQAQYGDSGSSDPLAPQLVQFKKQGIGSAYVKVNPNWFDPSRPRSDIQLIIVYCWYGGMDPDRPGIEHGNAANLRIWETLHKSDWKAISGALTK